MVKLLEDLICDSKISEFVGDKKINIAGIAYHSQRVKPHFLFVAMAGSKTSGVQFIDEAIKRGAVAVVIKANERLPDLSSLPVTLIRVENPKLFLAQIANRFYDYPSQKLKLIGITGTNGKTTTAYFAKSILNCAGKTAGILGTLGHYDGEAWIKAENTTPESLDVIAILAKLVRKGASYCILEVSSHALALDRVAGLYFPIAVFTNLTQEHLDFHKTIEAYKQAKLKLFTNLTSEAIAILNKDDTIFAEIKNITKARIISYSLKNSAEITAKVLSFSPTVTIVKLNIEGSEIKINLPLPGIHNVQNLLAAAGISFALNLPLSAIKEGIEQVKTIPGRLERIENKKGINVFVDYAHTPDALRNLITTAREFSPKRVLTLFGCGGNRDSTKRPIMGRIATELADYVIITSDNPRSEDPNKIIEEIKAGIIKTNFEIIPDRYQAIKRILALSKKGDTVLIAGKGHENYQIIGNEIKHFDDRVVVKRFLAD